MPADEILVRAARRHCLLLAASSRGREGEGERARARLLTLVSLPLVIRKLISSPPLLNLVHPQKPQLQILSPWGLEL